MDCLDLQCHDKRQPRTSPKTAGSDGHGLPKVDIMALTVALGDLGSPLRLR